MRRLEELEGRERSRQENKEAKKNASYIFKQWDVDMGQGLGLSLNDLKDSHQGHARPAPRYQMAGQQPIGYGIPSAKQMRLTLPKFN